MKAAIVESRPLVGLGIQRVLQRIADIDDSRVVPPRVPIGGSLQRTELLVVGTLTGGYSGGMLDLLKSAANVRCVLYLVADGELQWMPPSQIAPLMSWLPEQATADQIEHALRTLITMQRAACGTQPEPPTPSVLQDAPDELTPTVSPSLPVATRSTGIRPFVTEPGLLNLTPRQYDVLVLLSKGLPIKLISRRLHISVPTVKSHTLQLYRRLGVTNKAEAVFVAREKGAALVSVVGES